MQFRTILLCYKKSLKKREYKQESFYIIGSISYLLKVQMTIPYRSSIKLGDITKRLTYIQLAGYKWAF